MSGDCRLSPKLGPGVELQIVGYQIGRIGIRRRLLRSRVGIPIPLGPKLSGQREPRGRSQAEVNELSHCGVRTVSVRVGLEIEFGAEAQGDCRTSNYGAKWNRNSGLDLAVTQAVGSSMSLRWGIASSVKRHDSDDGGQEQDSCSRKEYRGRGARIGGLSGRQQRRVAAVPVRKASCRANAAERGLHCVRGRAARYDSAKLMAIEKCCQAANKAMPSAPPNSDVVSLSADAAPERSCGLR